MNCYKRLQLGAGIYSSRSGFTWTPAFITYGDNNRTQMIRTAGEGHFEDRTISAAANPYLALAAYLVAGLDGIERGLEPGEPNLGQHVRAPPRRDSSGGIQVLPQSLAEALDALGEDEVVQSALGPIADEFLKIKADEWAEYDSQVSRWEIDRYLTSV